MNIQNELLSWNVATDFLIVKCLVGNDTKSYYLEFETALFCLTSSGYWNEAETYENELGELMLEMDYGSDKPVKDILWNLDYQGREIVMNEAVSNLNAERTAVILYKEKKSAA